MIELITSAVITQRLTAVIAYVRVILSAEMGNRLVCLPAFFVAGFPKAATTDLYERMSKHQYIEPGNQKEHFWWHSAAQSGKI